MTKLILSFSILCLTIIPKVQGQAKVNTDSIPIISRADVVNFNQLLKTGATYDQYTKLTPEATLIALLNWKTEQMNIPKEQHTDSTTKKPK